jgi:hypothetical protein
MGAKELQGSIHYSKIITIIKTSFENTISHFFYKNVIVNVLQVVYIFGLDNNNGWPHGLMVMTADFESASLGSIPSEALYYPVSSVGRALDF